MIAHLMIALDGSRSSLGAALYGLTLAEQLHARVTLLSVLPPPELITLGPLSGYVALRLPRSDEDVAKIKTSSQSSPRSTPGWKWVTWSKWAR